MWDKWWTYCSIEYTVGLTGTLCSTLHPTPNYTRDYCMAVALPLRLMPDGVAVGNGDWGTLGVPLEDISPLIMSWIEASRASTREDICPTGRVAQLVLSDQ